MARSANDAVCTMTNNQTCRSIFITSSRSQCESFEPKTTTSFCYARFATSSCIQGRTKMGIFYKKSDIPDHLQKYFVPAEIGLEQTPEQYVAAMVEVFRCVRDVLANDGTLWLNIGDSYAGQRGSQPGRISGSGSVCQGKGIGAGVPEGIKSKDLIGIPWALAKALRDPYYTGSIKREMDRVWLAAMMDGEGTISGFYHDRADGTGVRTGVNVCLTNTCTQIIDRAGQIWPASLHPHMQNNERLGTRDVFRWKPNGAENIGDFLAELYPYLMTKKRQAMLAWNLMQFSKDGQKWGKSNQADEVRQKRETLVRLISSLNHGELVVIPDWVKEPPSLYEPGWYLRQDVIWHKPNPMPESVRDRCTKAHEYVFLLSKSDRYFFDSEANKEAAVSEKPAGNKRHKYADAYAAGTSEEHRTKAGLLALQGIEWERRNRRSVWTVATRPYKGTHFATFPPALIEPCILAGSRPGDVVLDPFMGSGTTAAVSLQHGRKYLGCELNPDYEPLQQERIGLSTHEKPAAMPSRRSFKQTQTQPAQCGLFFGQQT